MKKGSQLTFIDYEFVTYLWQETHGEPVFRIQTNDPKVKRKLNRTKEVTPVGEGMNSSLWIFKIIFESPNEAPGFLHKITNLKVRKTDDRHGYIAGHGALAKSINRTQVLI